VSAAQRALSAFPFEASSFSPARLRSVTTVFGWIFRRAAISFDECPAATSSVTCASRALNLPMPHTSACVHSGFKAPYLSFAAAPSTARTPSIACDSSCAKGAVPWTR